MININLSKKIFINFILLIILSILITSIIGNIKINKNFNVYLESEQLERINKIANDIDSYTSNYTLVEDAIFNYSNMENLNIQLIDDNNKIIISSNGLNSSHMGMGMGHMHNKMNRKSQDIPRYEEVKYSLSNNYSLIIGYEDSSYLYNDNVNIFKKTLRFSFLLSGFMTIIFSMFIIYFLSKSLTKPILNIKNKTIDITNGNLEEPIIYDNNITELNELTVAINKLQENLLLQETLRKEYALNISHELRTPITTIKSYLEAVKDEIWELDEDNLNTLIMEINNLSKLVEDLNNTFINESLNIKINKTKTNASKLLIDILNAYKLILLENNINLITNIQDDIIAYIDDDMFKHIISNLMNNSIKYNDKLNPQINITLDQSLINNKEYLYFSIKDNGSGIDGNDISKILNRFYRAKNNEDINSGTGLGLSIVNNYVNLHNGKIEIESEIGKFTSVKVFLPKNKEEING